MSVAVQSYIPSDALVRLPRNTSSSATCSAPSSYYGNPSSRSPYSAQNSSNSGHSRRQKTSSNSTTSSSISHGDPTHEGYVEGFPPRDCFTSGASRRQEEPYFSRSREGSRSPPERHQAAARRYAGSLVDVRGRRDEGGDFEQDGWEGTVSPNDSVSQVSSASSRRKKDLNRRSVVGEKSGKSWVGGERYMDEEDGFDVEGNAGYGSHERPVFNREMGYFERVIRPWDARRS